MFDFIAKHKRLLQVLLALIIIPPFAFFGIQSFDIFVGRTDLARVDGSAISLQEFSREADQQRDQLRSALGRNFDPAQLDTPATRKQLLDNLVTQRVLALYMARSRLLVTDDQVRELIAAEPAFHEDGKFSRSRYRELIRAENRSEEQFEAGLRSDLLRRQLSAGLLESAVVAKVTVRRVAAIYGESREVSESLIPASRFVTQVQLAPDAVERYYESHPREFEASEQMRAEYVQLSQDAVVADEPVSPDEVRAFYEASLAPKRRARLDARQKAEGILAAAREDPAKFAELAKSTSQDPGSAAQGGDVGWFGRGAMVRPFEDAVFKLKRDEISPLVETEFGFHVIKLIDIRSAAGGKGEERRTSHILINAPAEVKEFEVARVEIERDLKRQKGLKKFPELAESFSNMAYEQPDSLQPLAERFKLDISTAGWFSRAGAPAPLSNPKLVRALFTDDSIRSRRNTEAVEIAPGRLVVARVLEHKPAAVRPLEEVRAQITKDLVAETALARAREQAQSQLKQLESGQGAGVAWGLARTVSRENRGALDPRAFGPIFRVDGTKLPAYVGVDLSPTGYGLYRVSKINPAQSADEAKLRAIEAGLTRQEARGTNQAFVDGLRGRSKIELYEARLPKARE